MKNGLDDMSALIQACWEYLPYLKAKVDVQQTSKCSNSSHSTIVTPKPEPLSKIKSGMLQCSIVQGSSWSICLLMLLTKLTSHSRWQPLGILSSLASALIVLTLLGSPDATALASERYMEFHCRFSQLFLMDLVTRHALHSYVLESDVANVLLVMREVIA